MKFCKKCQCETEHYRRGGCRPCGAIQRAAYYTANSEKIKAASAAYYAANHEKCNAYHATYRAANQTKIKAYKAVYSSVNSEKAKAKSLAWYCANKEKAKASSTARQKANPEAGRIVKHNRRARERTNGGVLSKGLSAKLFKLQRGKCPCCKQPLGEDYHLDHIVPIALGGANEDWNMQLLTKTCNLQKHAKHPIDFMQSRGFLL